MARVININKLTFKQMLRDFRRYSGLPDGLIELPIPSTLKIGIKQYSIPATMEELSSNICYGQRLYIVRKEENDIGLIVRVITGYYYPMVTGENWDEDKAVRIENKILTCRVKELYPVAMHLNKLISEVADREVKLLHREPSKLELAAGIEKLDIYSEMMSLDFLRDSMKITIPEVILTPYDECLVRFMIQKETAAFNDRYFELSKETAKPKARFHEKT